MVKNTENLLQAAISGTFWMFSALLCFGSGEMTVIYALGKPQLATVINLLRLLLLPVAILVGSLYCVADYRLCRHGICRVRYHAGYIYNPLYFDDGTECCGSWPDIHHILYSVRLADHAGRNFADHQRSPQQSFPADAEKFQTQRQYYLNLLFSTP
ncbi:MAG: hypothetical protein KJN62_02790 [Deltaproteobacteria bacterium]|nr:hypothetical protein [Deltaproteobacteria bacterium]